MAPSGGLAILAAAVLAGCGGGGTTRHRPAAAPTRTPAPAARGACGDVAPGDREIGTTIVHGPAGAPRRPPLLLAFHGVSDSARQFGRWTGLTRLADRRGFVVAYPEMAPGRRLWDLNPTVGTGDVERVRRLVARLQAGACTDPARLYLTGFSNGGGFTARLACELGTRVAAAVSVNGSYRAVEPCPRGPRVGVMEVHGDDQFAFTVPRLIATWRTRDGCGAPAVVHRAPRGVTRTSWPGCPLVRVHLARTRHVWPGTAPRAADPTGFRASEAMWAFVRRHRRCGASLCAVG